ncbi:transposase, partial [Aerosakkonema funiforme]|uniref:transposase n=1 Tax=Aerosakkonema funiforme TaxID=1246630 RepID=UPI0035B8521C
MRLETLTFGSELEVKSSDTFIDYTFKLPKSKSREKKDGSFSTKHTRFTNLTTIQPSQKSTTWGFSLPHPIPDTPPMRPPRQLHPHHTYHITVRCNNREFKLHRRECRHIILFALKKAIEKYHFRLYALCILSNHVHYLIEPATPTDLPKIMHWLNWYTAMCLNRMLNRTGHFWEKRYYSTSFPKSDHKRALCTLRYIHGNPKAAGIKQ